MSDVSLPFALGDVPERAKRDGCECPPWVERCAHFNGQTLLLTCGGQIKALLHNPSCPAFLCEYEVSILEGEKVLDAWNANAPCPRCGANAYSDRAVKSRKHFYGSELAAALTAFHEAEQRLLDGAL